MLLLAGVPPLIWGQALKELVTPATKLISLVHVSNMLGCELDVEAVVAAARGVGAKVLLDSCQAVPHSQLDVQALGVDWIVASSHKMMGPTGIGFLWGRWDDLDLGVWRLRVEGLAGK